MAPLDACNGTLVFGSESSPYDNNPSAVLISPGETLTSEVMEIPSKCQSVSFDVRATPRGNCTLTVRVRGGNREFGTLVDLGVTSPDALNTFTADAGAIVSVSAEFNFIQLEIACTGAAAELVVVGAARQAASLGLAYTV